MVGMPLLNLGYGLSGLTQGYNQAQQQAMQRAAQQLALQQAQAQQAGKQALSRYLQSGDFKGFGGMFGGGFNPANINPISQPSVASPPPTTGVTTPSQAPTPPALQQPPPATTPDAAPTPTTFGSPYYGGTVGTGDADPDKPAGFALGGTPYYTPGTGAQTDTPSDKSATPASPVTTTPDTKPAPGPSDAAPSSTAPSTVPATTSDASSGTDGGGQMGITIGNQTIPLSQFFGTVDYGELAKGIAKYVPPGTDQSAIYEAVLDLSKLAEGNKTQQQQAGLILRELIGHPFKMEEIGARGQIQTNIAAAHDTAAQKRAETAATSRETVGAAHDATTQRGQDIRAKTAERGQDVRADTARRGQDLADAARTASRGLREQGLKIQSDREKRLAEKQVADLERLAENAGLNYLKAQLNAIGKRISTFKPGPDGNYNKSQQDQLSALNAQAAAIGEQIAAQAQQAAPTQ